MNFSSKRQLIFSIAIFLISIGLFGLLIENNKTTLPNSYAEIKNFKPNFLQIAKFEPKTSIFSVFPTEIKKPTKTPTPTPTPDLTFRHSKWLFSFEIPENSQVQETTPGEILIVENSIGGVFIEKPTKFQIEIGIVDLYGLNLYQYFHNRLANIFSEKIIKSQESTESGILKGYEIYLKNEELKQDKIIIFLPFRGNQIFEIEAIFLKKNHQEEDKIISELIKSLKPY